MADRSIVIYLVLGDAEGADRAPYDMLMRASHADMECPALTESDRFIAQATRMLGHVGIEWSWLALLFEFKTCVHFSRYDEAFWRKVVLLGRSLQGLPGRLVYAQE
jgi:hypothetical protein